MADLDPAHVEAVARHLANDWNPDRDIILTAMFRDYAATILTSTDPAVHAAMLAALVRAGIGDALTDALTPMIEALVPGAGGRAESGPAAPPAPQVVDVHLHPPCPDCGAQRAAIDGGDVEHLFRPQDLSDDLLACPSLLAESSG